MFVVEDSYKNNKVYGGRARKFGITVDGVDYIVKFGSSDLSVYSEVIASRFLSSLGVLVQDAELGVYGKDFVAVIKDFVSGTGSVFQSYGDIAEPMKGYSYGAVLKGIPSNARDSFLEMCVCDAILGNSSRKASDWGYLVHDGEYQFAPIYDNADCLFPNVYRNIKKYQSKYLRHDFMYDLVYRMPSSLLSSGMGYHRAFGGLYDKAYVQGFCDKFSVNDLHDSMMVVCKGICSPLYADFYSDLVALRYGVIVRRWDFDVVWRLLGNG